GLTAPDSAGAAASCGEYQSVPVPLQRGGRKYGQKRISVLAVGSDNRKDRDELILRCVPRVGACPTTTTSTTPPTITTTSSTIAPTTSTLAPPTSTIPTTTSSSTSTTSTSSSSTTSTTTGGGSTTSTTSTSSTTSSTAPSSCGDGIVGTNEECDPAVEG